MEKMFKKTVVFDFDGTLTDSMSVENHCMVKAMQSVGCFSVSEEKLPNYYGPTERGIIKAVVPPDRLEEAWANCLNIYRETSKNLKPYPGIEEILRMLKSNGVKVFLVTGRSKETLDISLENMDLTGYFLKTYSGSDSGTNKEESLTTLIHDFSLSKEETIYIGDTLDDIRMMGNIGIDIISAGYSHTEEYRKQLEIKNPGLVVDSLGSLRTLLMKITGSH